jgi:hypothetical protein
MLAGKAEISAAQRALGELVIAAVLAIAAVPVLAAIAVVPVWAAIAVVPVVIAWAIAVSAAALRWVIAADLAAGRAATAGGVLVPAAVAAHPAWEVSAAVEADIVAAVCAAAAACAVAAVAAVAEVGGKHHENRKTHHEIHDFESALAKTSRSRRVSNSAAQRSADRRISCPCASNNNCERQAL